MPEAGREKKYDRNSVEGAAQAKRGDAEAASASAVSRDENAEKLRVAAAKTNTDPDVPILPEEKSGGLVGAAAYARRKRKVLEDYRAKNQAQAIK